VQLPQRPAQTADTDLNDATKVVATRSPQAIQQLLTCEQLIRM
jgi:hypothetical protein